MRISLSELENLVLQLLQTKYKKADAERIRNVIMYAELSDKNSHGIVRLIGPRGSVMGQEPEADPEITEMSALSKTIDAQKNPGMLVAHMAMEEVIEIASDKGFGIVTTKNSFSTSGCLAYFLQQIAAAGLIGFVYSESPKLIAPMGSTEGLFGTNPFTAAIPAKKFPLIFDMASSAISLGEILRAKATGEQLPENSTIDSEGNITTDPQKALEGAILPFDRSYKGSGIAMVIEILGGILAGSGFADINRENGWGNTFIAFKPSLVTDAEVFAQNVDTFLERVRNAKTKDGSKLRIFGENSQQTIIKNKAAGFVEIEDSVHKEIVEYINVKKA